jgi:hypothetical protein
MSKPSQTSRDRLAFNFLIAIPVVAVLVLIHRAQSASAQPSATTP